MVSLIVPVYNSEKYLPRCIESVLNQTYKNIELILINDGSKDNSGEICDLYAQRDDRVIVIHRENSGVSDARNEGIKISRGEYLQFADSDDYLEKDMTYTLLNAAVKNGSDIVFCGYKTINSLTEEIVPTSYIDDMANLNKETLLLIFDELYLNSYINSPWNKLYKTTCIKNNDIHFKSNLDLGEDLIFNLDVIEKCNNFSIVSTCLYNYILYNDLNQLSTRYRSNMYEIQKMLFEKAVNIFPDHNKYSVQINKIERAYVESLFQSVLFLIAANSCLTEYKVFTDKADLIRRDQVLNRLINDYGAGTKQKKLESFLIMHEMYSAIFLYVKTKIFIKHKLPFLFKSLKKWGDSNG